MEPNGGGDKRAPGPWWKRLAWFVLFWAAGVSAVGAIAFLLRAILL